ncbi:uncharacterized protein [Palaemon carinicauda]|uniref:uncharacterized protein isoform X3 n=1 Tax=Palaemon carinicauda TaxID=392227 RepID=UPI0035B5C003
MDPYSTTICGQHVGSLAAAGIICTGQIILIPGIFMVVFISINDYDDDDNIALIVIGSICITIGFILTVIGGVIRKRIRMNFIRTHLPVMTVSPVGAYPATVHPATLYPSSTAHVVPPGYMPQGVQAPQGMQAPQGFHSPHGMQASQGMQSAYGLQGPQFMEAPPPYEEVSSTKNQTS